MRMGHVIGEGRNTAFYTPIFAKRVVDVMLENDDWNQAVVDLHHGISKDAMEGIDHGED